MILSQVSQTAALRNGSKIIRQDLPCLAPGSSWMLTNLETRSGQAGIPDIDQVRRSDILIQLGSSHHVCSVGFQASLSLVS